MKIYKVIKTGNTPVLLVRLTVGLIFLSEGLQKFILPEVIGYGRFAEIGFANPEFWAWFTGVFEIVCGLLVTFGLLTRLAVIPLLCIMIVAFIMTKWPVLKQDGFWAMAHAYRTDFAMTMLSLVLLISGSGKFSLDQLVTASKGSVR